jgi:hypothetical protein
MRALVLLIILLTAAASVSYAQTQRLKVYLDCNGDCDETFIKSEITLVDFVLDRLAADIHVLITSQPSGSGGNSIQLAFLGQNTFKGRDDKIFCSIPANATGVEKRDEITQRIKLGLVPYLSNSSAAGLITVQLKGKEVVRPTEDHWNYWVYRIGLDGTYEADQNYQNAVGSGSISANRTTDKMRVNFSLYSSYNYATYNYDDNGTTETYEVINSSYRASHYLVRNVSQRWSLGYEASYYNSTFSNYKSRIYFSPAIEFAIFPYKEVNEKFFAISYGPKLMHNIYYDTTIYNQTEELLAGQELKANLSVRQKWGNLSTAIIYSNYFKDWQLNNLAASVNLNVRITGGLSLYLYASGGLVHDQVSLARGGATQQEILTRQRQLATSYTYYSGLGISYRFGSILNNFVNPSFPNY